MLCTIFINVDEENRFCHLVITQAEVSIEPAKHKLKLFVLSDEELENYYILFHPLNSTQTYHA